MDGRKSLPYNRYLDPDFHNLWLVSVNKIRHLVQHDSQKAISDGRRTDKRCHVPYLYTFEFVSISLRMSVVRVCSV